VRATPSYHALSCRYPPNANKPRFRTMVKPTLSAMLTTIQKRQPLPNDRRCPRRYLLFEYHILHDSFQVGQSETLPLRVGVF
jgi:hypothetical protein